MMNQYMPDGTLSGAWLVSRRGALSSSRMNDALAFLKNGKEAEARKQYKQELVAERVSDYAVERFVTGPMTRGLTLEPDARAAYELKVGEFLHPARLFLHPSIEHFVATPDAPQSDHVVEFKCPMVKTYMDWWFGKEIPEQHKNQMAAQILCAQKEYAVFVAYCPEMPENRQLFIREYRPTAEELEKVEQGAKVFLAEVDAMFDAFIATEEPK